MKDKIATAVLILVICSLFGLFAYMMTIPEYRENFRKMNGTKHRCDCVCCQAEGGD